MKKFKKKMHRVQSEIKLVEQTHKVYWIQVMAIAGDKSCSEGWEKQSIE